MDEFNSTFGRLSTNAAEWKPPSSDLNAGAVKEFIPGHGWATTDGSGQQQQVVEGKTASPSEQNEYGAASIPAGPSPPEIPAFRGLHSMGVHDDLYRYYRELSLEALRQMDPNDPQHKAIPPPYCNAHCLDSKRSSFGYPCSTFQVASREDGHLYCLKRFDNVRSVSPKIAVAVSDRWTRGAPHEHPGIVPLYMCFVAQRAVFFVHQYIPGARTLQERLFSEGSISESILWSCISQLVSAIRCLHVNNLAVRALDLQHVLSVTDYTGSRLRVRLGSLGIVDALEFEARKHVQDLQVEDIRNLGRLILSLAVGAEVTTNMDVSQITRCEACLAQNFSRELHNLTVTLINAPRPPSIIDISRAVASRVFDEQDAVYVALDRSEQALFAEHDASRALRLLLKLGFITERPELGPNRRWAQSGECYVLTLFRDYVFFQADGAGYPVMDLGHVVTALNKLDALDEEKIVLASRDGKSLMVVSYADISRCLETAFHELCSSATPSSAFQYL